MTDAMTTLWLGLRAAFRAGWDREAAPAVPEPEFEPFHLPGRRGAGQAPRPVPADGIGAANTARTARTLAELGVPGPLAAEMETTLRAMGMVEGDRIVGFTFRTPDGAAHPLRVGAEAREASPDRAA